MFLKKNKINWPAWPNIKKKHLNAVSKVLKKNQLFAAEEVKKFETEFGKFNNSKYVKAVGNATQGLHLALSALEIGYGDEVIVTGFSWISTASCILMQNAKPVFVDIEKNTLGADPKEIEKKITKKTKAIIVVHMFGNICKIEEVSKIAKKNNVFLIEDASHAHGANLKNVNSGNFSDIAVFSCHQRKNLFCGEGGLVVCRKKKHNDKIYKLRSFGEKKLSYNYRMTEAYAAIGRVSLKTLKTENRQRLKNANNIIKLLKNSKGFNIIKPKKNSLGVFHKLIINYEYKYFRKNLGYLINHLNKKGIPANRVYVPLNHHTNFNITKSKNKSFPNINLRYKKNVSLPVTEEFSYKRLFELSIHPGTKIKHIEFFTTALNDYEKKFYKFKNK
tara:strand:- start:11069 stop:12235 length:1167 start_codon:yes stop_codon:yes gene_type:complete